MPREDAAAPEGPLVTQRWWRSQRQMAWADLVLLDENGIDRTATSDSGSDSGAAPARRRASLGAGDRRRSSLPGERRPLQDITTPAAKRARFSTGSVPSGAGSPSFDGGSLGIALRSV
mmetsp:Transcript_77965/g.178386  ORF Transcript_77965/g.178386 Transcript_77965/m.178386 type:complete len:118 (-) Transcript_77965:120-473(-)